MIIIYHIFKHTSAYWFTPIPSPPIGIVLFTKQLPVLTIRTGEVLAVLHDCLLEKKYLTVCRERSPTAERDVVNGLRLLFIFTGACSCVLPC